MSGTRFNSNRPRDQFECNVNPNNGTFKVIERTRIGAAPVVALNVDNLPLTVFGCNPVERFFTPEEIKELPELVQTLAA